ncbi:MAG: hypothetical protein AAF597_00440, partial [Bacteroidota bacterium]
MISLTHAKRTNNTTQKASRVITNYFLLLIFLLATPLAAQDGLRDVADPKKVYVGNLISNAHLDDPENFRGGLANPHLLEEYNATVLENYMKMSFVLPGEQPADIHNLTVAELRDV